MMSPIGGGFNRSTQHLLVLPDEEVCEWSGMHGHGSGEGGKPKGRDLIGMYLGETDCLNENHSYVTYGYALDLKQAADLLGASNLQGDFNV